MFCLNASSPYCGTHCVELGFTSSVLFAMTWHKRHRSRNAPMFRLLMSMEKFPSKSASYSTVPWRKYATLQWYHINDLVQDCSISSALAMEILQSCAKSSTWELRCLKSLAVDCSTAVQANNKDNIKAPYQWPLKGNGGFPSQRASDTDDISMSRCYHEPTICLPFLWAHVGRRRLCGRYLWCRIQCRRQRWLPGLVSFVGSYKRHLHRGHIERLKRRITRDLDSCNGWIVAHYGMFTGVDTLVNMPWCARIGAMATLWKFRPSSGTSQHVNPLHAKFFRGNKIIFTFLCHSSTLIWHR